MVILGIETSCDETAASIIDADPKTSKVKILSNVVASSLNLHAKTGGIIPEIAARQQIKYIIPVIKKSLIESHLYPPAIDALAVTIGPGLIGSLLVGIETAKTLSFAWDKPIIPVNHLIGHIYANFISDDSSIVSLRSRACRGKSNLKIQKINDKIVFPTIVLIVSGGHTDLLLMKNNERLKWLGGTRDDAAGEAFDKIARLLNLPYPGGPAISAEAEKFKVQSSKLKITLPRPMINSHDFDFSFSGLKTAVLREVNELKAKKQFNNLTIQQLAYEVQKAVVDILVTKTLKAAQQYKVKSILLSGGVAANEPLRKTFEVESYKLGFNFFAPSKSLCTDNAVMIATAAYFNYKPTSWQKITANPELHF